MMMCLAYGILNPFTTVVFLVTFLSEAQLCRLMVCRYIVYTNNAEDTLKGLTKTNKSSNERSLFIDTNIDNSEYEIKKKGVISSRKSKNEYLKGTIDEEEEVDVEPESEEKEEDREDGEEDANNNRCSDFLRCIRRQLTVPSLEMAYGTVIRNIVPNLWAAVFISSIFTSL